MLAAAFLCPWSSGRSQNVELPASPPTTVSSSDVVTTPVHSGAKTVNESPSDALFPFSDGTTSNDARAEPAPSDTAPRGIQNPNPPDPASAASTDLAAIVDAYTAAELPLPEIGDHQLRILSPYLLELHLVTTKQKGKNPEQWNFFDPDSRKLDLPEARDFDIRFGDQSILGAVAEVGFKRRPEYAPHRYWDPRIGNWLYLKLKQPVPEGATVTVRERSGELWAPDKVTFPPATTSSAIRPRSMSTSPAIRPASASRLASATTSAISAAFPWPATSSIR